MNNFATYYKDNFQQDIIQFFSTVPDQSRFHEDIQNKQTFSIQYERLTKDFDHLNFLNKPNKEYFGIALFFTVLLDMVCYSDYRQHYEKYNRLTRYPKFIGNCPAGCHYHYNPSDIFAAMNFSRKKPLDMLSPERLDFYGKFNEAVSVMEIETLHFFSEYVPEIKGQDFWNKCRQEFPYRFINEEIEE